MDGSPSLQDLAKVHRVHVSTSSICPGLLHKIMLGPILGWCPDFQETAPIAIPHVGLVGSGKSLVEQMGTWWYCTVFAE